LAIRENTSSKLPKHYLKENILLSFLGLEKLLCRKWLAQGHRESW